MKTALLTLLSLAFVLQPARATEFVAAEHFRLSSGATLTDELWMKATTVDMEGTAEDDVFILTDGTTEGATNAMASVRLSGALQADVWAAGESIQMTGTVARHARLLGFKSVSVGGPVGRNLIALGSTVLVGETADIGGQALLAGRDILVHGTVRGDTRIYGSKVTVSGKFEKNLTITADDVTVMPGTRIDGNLYYTLVSDLLLDPGVTLGGQLIKVEPRVVAHTPAFSLGTVWLQIGFYCGALLVGMAFIGIFPGIVAMSMHHLASSGWRCLLIGFVAFCLIPMVACFLVFTIVGIPLCVVTLCAYLILVYTGKLVTGIYLGHVLLRRRQIAAPMPLLPLLSLGLLVMYAGGCVPFPVDITLWFAFTLLGMGALVSAILDRRTPVMVSVPQEPPPAPPPLP